MGNGADKLAPGRSSAVADSTSGSSDAGQAVGKQTLTEQLPADGGAQVAQPAAPAAAKKPSIPGTIVAGGPLSDADVENINKAAASLTAFKRYVAYADVIKVGGTLAWRCNNPGNLRDSASKIGTVPGASGTFAAFATMDDGRAAQRSLYLDVYGDKTVRAAIQKLTPPSENDTEGYLKQLAAAGVDLDKDVKSQIDVLMPAVEANEGMITGTIVPRSSAGAGAQ